MSASVNKVILVGNLGRDPEVRSTQGGNVVTFSLAVSDSWKDKTTGERKENTLWANIVIFNENIGRVAEQYLRKGSKVYLEGQLQSREYTDKEGNRRTATEVVISRFKGELVLLDAPRDRNDSPKVAPPPEKSSRKLRDVIDDEIPF